ncbi:hypothetical protein EHS25_006673 [Saitozyma podzolica]|uniref:Uncharacterized protein n=1 Tax=Saitozyma podzolica TaxID=1890683 RepID=A0A427YSG4_9TREE|nr:hypothetical protein EHS25_006673 [Saitozyma podzolica]
MHLATPIVLAAVAVAPALAASVPNLVKIRRAGGSVGNVLAGAPITNITVTPSNVVQCSTASISWTGATDPVDLSIGVGGFYVGTTWITTLSSISGGSATWLVDQPSGEDLIFEIKDANGQVGYTQNVQVASSGDSSCLSSGSSTSSSWSSASATTDGSGSSSAADASATPDAASASPAPVSSSTSHSSSRSSRSASRSASAFSESSAAPMLSLSSSSSSSTAPASSASSSSGSSATLAAAASTGKTSAARRDIAAGGVGAVLGLAVISALVGGAL